jgi:hypothetical protein
MPAGLRWFAEYQPFTPIIETLRGLLTDKPLGNNAWIALAWCAVIALGGYLWSKQLFNREFGLQPRRRSMAGRRDPGQPGRLRPDLGLDGHRVDE